MSNKIIKDLGDNILIVYPSNYKKKETDCPNCGLAFRDKQDIVSYLQYGLCTDCKLDIYIKEHNYQKKE
mgnify:CR=1 FL=1